MTYVELAERFAKDVHNKPGIALAIFQYDEETGTYLIYPDISPEQGPFAHNTTITIASVKYMLQFTLKSAEILGDNDPMLADVRNLFEKLPPYYSSEESKWGVHLKDSLEAPDNQWLRHPSMLMQSYNGVIRVFPAMPDGNREWERFHREGWGIGDFVHRCRDYDAWKDVRFDRLLARGAF